MEPRNHVHHLLRDHVRNSHRHHQGAPLGSLCRATGSPLTPTFQDLPDVEGDRQHNIQTFATQLGVRNISLAVRGCVNESNNQQALWHALTGCILQAIGMLLASYATAIVLALRLPGIFNAPLMVAGHAVLAGALLLKVCELARSLRSLRC